jgi:hypothetical protein
MWYFIIGLVLSGFRIFVWYRDLPDTVARRKPSMIDDDLPAVVMTIALVLAWPIAGVWWAAASLGTRKRK